MKGILKYLHIAKLTIDEMIEYRASFFMWRIRNVFYLITTYFLWSAVIPASTQFAGYNRSLLLTYMIGASFLSSIVFTSRSNGIGDMINQGNLSNFLIRPFNFFFYWVGRDAGDKCMNILLAIFEYTVFIILFHPPLVIQTNILVTGMFVISLFMAIAIAFFFNFLLGFIAFWSSEVWAPRFIFMVVISFFAGGFFPLNILPPFWYNLMMITPFPYMQYVPMQVYIGNIGGISLVVAIGMSVLWSLVLWKMVMVLWKKGLQVYSAEGR